MRRFWSIAGLFLTAYFALAGAFHQHELPQPGHQHAGFCSKASVSPQLDSCAICKAGQTNAQPTAGPVAAVEARRATGAVAPSTTALIAYRPARLAETRAPPLA